MWKHTGKTGSFSGWLMRSQILVLPMSIVAFGSPTGLRYSFMLVFGEMLTTWAMYKCGYPYAALILVLSY